MRVCLVTNGSQLLNADPYDIEVRSTWYALMVADCLP